MNHILFDVTMGSYDGAEVCELVGLFLLHKLRENKVEDVGVYRDDGLEALKMTPRQMEQTKKTICRVFAEYGLKISIETNKKTVNFLDVTFDLTLGVYKPYSKPNTTHLYVNKQSNHPPSILKNIAKGINQRISSISSNEDIFNKAAPEYQEALNKAGYDFKLKFDPDANKPKERKSKNRNRKRKVTWFNPPYSSSVKTRVGQKFLELLDKCFPKTGPLWKLFNRNTVKISYRTAPNLQQILSGHNKKVLSKNTDKPQPKLCSCPKGTTCPLEAKCLSENLIYQATVTETTSDNKQVIEKYIGLSAPPFKKRLGNHLKSFKNKKHSTEATLSTHI